MPAKKTTSTKTKTNANAKAWLGAVNVKREEAATLAQSEDEDVVEAYNDIAGIVADMAKSQQAYGQQILSSAKENEILGNVLAGTELYGHGKAAFEMGQHVVKGAQWLGGKVGKLF